MFRMTMVMKVSLLAMVLLLPLTATLPTSTEQRDLEGPSRTLEDETAAPTAADTMASDEAVTYDHDDDDDDDDEMRGRMAYLILSLWGRDLQGLEGLDGQDGAAYRTADEPLQHLDAGNLERNKRDIVFRPLWATRQRHAAKSQIRQRYWEELRRYQRIGRDVNAVLHGHVSRHRHQRAAPAVVPLIRSEAMETHRQLPRPRRAAPLTEDSLMATTELRSLARVRRQWAFRPLFSSRRGQAQGPILLTLRQPRREANRRN